MRQCFKWKKLLKTRRSEQQIRSTMAWSRLQWVIEGTSAESTGGDIVPTSKCIEDTKELRLVTRNGRQRLRCCVCHLHHKQAMNAPAPVRQIFRRSFRRCTTFDVDVIAGDANAAAYRYFKRQEYQDLHNSSVAILLRGMRGPEKNLEYDKKHKTLKSKDEDKKFSKMETFMCLEYLISILILIFCRAILELRPNT